MRFKTRFRAGMNERFKSGTRIRVVPSLVVNVRDGGVVLQDGVRVRPLGVEVADTVVGLHDAAELAVPGVVEAGVRREHEQLPRLEI